jgi:hypothetical protein
MPPPVIGILFYFVMTFIIMRVFYFSDTEESPDVIPDPEWDMVLLGIFGWPIFACFAWFPPVKRGAWKYRLLIALAWLFLGTPATGYLINTSAVMSVCALALATGALLIANIIIMVAADARRQAVMS